MLRTKIYRLYFKYLFLHPSVQVYCLRRTEPGAALVKAPAGQTEHDGAKHMPVGIRLETHREVETVQSNFIAGVENG